MADYIHDRKIALKALVGSHNYGINDENSDRDYKYFVFPSWEDIYTGKKFTASHNSETEDYTVHDIRELAKFLCKANINFLEVLFSTELTGDQRILDLFVPLREMFICMNYTAFYKGCLGTFDNKMAKWRKGRRYAVAGGLGDHFEWKEASNACRALVTLGRYLFKYKTFEKAFRKDTDVDLDEEFKELKRIRNGEWDESVLILYTDSLLSEAVHKWNKEGDQVRARVDFGLWNSYHDLDTSLSDIIYRHIVSDPA